MILNRLKWFIVILKDAKIVHLTNPSFNNAKKVILKRVLLFIGRFKFFFFKNTNLFYLFSCTFSFPKSGETLLLWLLATNRSESELKPDSRVCSEHFDETSFVSGKKKIILSNLAVPNMGRSSSVSNCCYTNVGVLGNTFLI